MTAKKELRAGQVFFYLGATIFGAESLVMFILSMSTFEERLTIFTEAILDSLLLLLLIFPVFHFALFRPMRLKISDLREAREEIRRKNRELAYMAEQMEQILVTAEEGVLGLDKEGRTIFTNPAAEKILGWSGEELIGKDHHGVIGQFCAENPRIGGCPARLCLFRGDVVHQVEARFRRKNGCVFPAEISCAPMKEGGEIIGAVLTFRDISERKKTEEKLKELAYYDPLTGLSNRPLLQDRFGQIAAQGLRTKHKTAAIMFIDLDDFKKINDRHGHAEGDAYLKEIADRARDVVRNADTVARIGGDEFVWAGLVRGPEEAALVARKILASLSSPILVNGNSLRVSASIGIALHSRHGEGFEELLKAADDAMYRAKEQGKNRFFISEDSRNGQEQSREDRTGGRKKHRKRRSLRIDRFFDQDDAENLIHTP